MYHTRPAAAVANDLGTNLQTGLSTSDAAGRLLQYGHNVLPEGRKTSKLKRFFRQFKDLLIFILLGAAAVSLFIGETKDATVILTIVIANALMGYYQEVKADNAIAALKKMAVTQAKVWREGKMQLIEAADLVPGDIIIIENGDKIPADARLIEAVCLQVLESALTGESRPVEKNADVVGAEHLPLGDRVNMIYKDTVVLMGRGQAIVTATGSRTCSTMRALPGPIQP